MQRLATLISGLRRFSTAEDGVVTLEFVLVFPIFFAFFMMTYENGMISLQHVMLERGVDLAVRDVRIGRLPEPSREDLRERICDFAGIIPDCMNQLQLELVRRDPRAWVDVTGPVGCVDRGDPGAPKANYTSGGNNQLMYLRACARIDPVLPSSGLLGVAITKNNSDAAAGGSYALVSSAAFVIEPFGASE